jgi:hypothetical protein
MTLPSCLTSAKIQTLRSKQVAMGFDGFIDSIVRVILEKQGNGNTTYFNTAAEFAQYTLMKTGSNFSLEVEETFRKIGGNMPIMANAMAGWGIDVHCIGALGFPEIQPIFRTMHPNCTLYTYAEPGLTTALEFGDSKIILGEMQKLNSVGWAQLVSAVGIDTLRNIFQTSDLVALLNWSELDHSTEVWRGLLNEVVPHLSPSSDPFVFFDLSDCSKRSAGSIREAAELIGKFSERFETILGVNLNEARLVHAALNGGKSDELSPAKTAEAIYQVIKPGILVMHYQTSAHAWKDGASYTVTVSPVSAPVLSTGAGDNFNAGFCLGILAGCAMEQTLELAHWCAGQYMQTGKSVVPEHL